MIGLTERHHGGVLSGNPSFLAADSGSRRSQIKHWPSKLVVKKIFSSFSSYTFVVCDDDDGGGGASVVVVLVSFSVVDLSVSISPSLLEEDVLYMGRNDADDI